MDRRLYTPPTCTLLVEAPSSWLPNFSQTSEQPRLAGLANLKFALSFDDPRQTIDSITVKGDRPLLDHLYLVVNTYIQNLLLNSWENLSLKTSSNSSNPGTPCLQQQTFCTHTLYLGSLFESEIRAIDLTTTQLFDLATALDTYVKELHAPVLINPWWKSKWFSNWGLGSIAIAFFLGLTSVGFHLLQAHNSAESIPDVPAPNNANSATFGLQVFPAPKVSIPPLPQGSPLAATQKLSIPSPVRVPSSGVAPSTPLIAPVERARGTLETTLLNPTNPPINSGLASPSNPQQATGNQGTNSLPASNQNNAIAPLAPVSPLQELPALPNLPPLNPDAVIPIPPQEIPQIKVNEDLRNDRGDQMTSLGESLFDRLPQVPEVRKYFQARWHPPGGLTQILEYSLLLNRDGTIARIIPLGQVSAANISRLGIPSANAPFVSPLINGGSNPPIRIVLTPEGRVQTFLESYN